ncbi:hypothetical protein CLOL250_02017 [Clostridium sp. L2-50]|nr:hypothetical protein CLOL250_02017 [Clostridium sp. L2-50]
MSGSGVCDEQGRCEDQQPLPQPAAQIPNPPKTLPKKQVDVCAIVIYNQICAKNVACN